MENATKPHYARRQTEIEKEQLDLPIPLSVSSMYPVKKHIGIFTGIEKGGKLDFKKSKILIADDSPGFIMYIGILLKRMGFTVIPAENGLEVLKLLKIVEPDVIMLDVNMPMLDGMAALKYVKEDRQTCSIPVIMVSVDSCNEIHEQCRSLGCSHFLAKPIKITKLYAALQDCLFSRTGTKRLHLRAPFNKKVVVICNGVNYELYAESISEGGIYIRKRDPFPAGSKLEIVCTLNEGVTLRLRGTVIYIKGLFGDVFKVPPGMAVEFREITEDESKILRCFTEKLLAEDIVDSQEEKIIEMEKNNRGCTK